jgi:hypothetical protein
MHTATFYFRSFDGEDKEIVKTVSNIQSLDHARMVGPYLVGQASMEAGCSMYLSNINVSNGSFECLCVPRYIFEGLAVA